jgi:hypothetical protein
MNNPDYDSIYEDLKNEYYNSFVNEYLEFEMKYDFKDKAVEDFRKLVKPILHPYTDIIVNNTLYFDQFKKRIEQKMNDCFERFKNPVKKMIEYELTKIIIAFKNQKELELSNDRIIQSFDYIYFDNFTELDAVKLIAKIKAHEKFHDYLNERIKLSYYNVNFQDNLNQDIGKLEKDKVEPIILDGSYTESIIKKLYKLLFDYMLIDAEEGDFLNHFKLQSSYNMIIWKGVEVEISYLFNLIRPKNKHIYILIKNHFLNNKGEYFDNKQLSSVYSGKSPTARIETVCEELKKFKNQ